MSDLMNDQIFTMLGMITTGLALLTTASFAVMLFYGLIKNLQN